MPATAGHIPLPKNDDLNLLHYLSQGIAASVATERCGLTLSRVAARTRALREHYSVSSTAAAAGQAALLGHLPRT